MAVKDLRVLNAIAKKYALEFDRIFKYYIGNPYKNANGDHLPHYFIYKDSVYSLKYFDGCFNPFLIEHKDNIFVYSKKNHEPVFIENGLNWNRDNFYTK